MKSRGNYSTDVTIRRDTMESTLQRSALATGTTKARTIGYWITTGLVVFFIGSGGFAYVMQVPDVVQGVVGLGFPTHFVLLLGVWKVLGSIALAVPRLPLIKEWAYFGIMLDLTGAAYTSIATGGEWWHAAAPLAIALLVVASWALRPERRRLPGATIRGLGLRTS
jgi:hypothetical protein